MLQRRIILWMVLSVLTLSGARAQALDERRLQLEQNRLQFEKDKYRQDHEEESRRDTGTLLSIYVSAGLAVAAYVAQFILKHRDEQLAFQLKAAEIMMESRDTSQARGKAELLTKLFPKRLKEVTGAMQREGALPYFGRTHESRELMLEMLSKYPECRADIIRGWAILFPWDSDSTWAQKTPEEKHAYKWFDQLQADTSLNANRTGGTGSGNV